MKILSDNQFIVAYYNLFDEEQEMIFPLADAGIPYSSGFGLEMTDVFTGELTENVQDYQRVTVPGHDCRLYLCRLVKCRR